jgi:hypothetical protein
VTIRQVSRSGGATNFLPMDGVAIHTQTVVEHDMIDPADAPKRKGGIFRKNKEPIDDEEKVNEYELDLQFKEKGSKERVVSFPEP